MRPFSPVNRLIPFAALCVALALPYSTALHAQNLAIWGELRPGPYSVGYEVLYEIDHSRLWVIVPDSEAQQEVSRPLRVSVWYPSNADQHAATMTLAEFVSDSSPDPYFGQLNALLEQRFSRLFSNTSDELYDALLSLPIATIKDAAPADGPFPLVMYSPGGQASLPDNGVLAAYLASHGYVVASVPQLEAHLRQEPRRRYSMQVETQTRDIEFAMGVLQEFPGIDRRKLAIVGYSFGGLVALRMASRNANVDAIVGLDPSFAYMRDPDQVNGAGDFDITTLRVPILSLQAGNTESRAAYSPVIHDTLHYADRYVGYVAETVHADFSEIKPMLIPALVTKEELGWELQEAHRGYTAVCEYVLNFLNGVFWGDSAGLSFVAASSEANGMDPDLVEMSVERRAEVPTEEEFVEMLERQGYYETARRLRAAQRGYPHLVVLRDGIMNAVGYMLRDTGELDLAINVFRLNTQANPHSARAFNGLAELHLTNGDSLMVISAYERMLEVLSEDSTLGPARKDELRRNAELRLRILMPSKPYQY
jgi:pimeloyl-ACP methyl ester carboxylesterase